MTLTVLWNRYAKWCEKNKESLHFNAVIGQKMEVDFAGKTFQIVDHLTGEVMEIVVFVAVLPYSQYIYAEGMVSVKKPQWIAVNNNALKYFGDVPALVVCDNCKQAVIANKDWIDPELNKDYAEWAEHNHTVILPAKVKKPKYKSSVENAVGILEKGIFHDMEEMDYFSLTSSTMTSGISWTGSTVPRSQKSPTAAGITGTRSAGNLCRCLQCLTNIWNGGLQRYPRTTISASTMLITAWIVLICTKRYLSGLRPQR